MRELSEPVQPYGDANRQDQYYIVFTECYNEVKIYLIQFSNHCRIGKNEKLYCRHEQCTRTPLTDLQNVTTAMQDLAELLRTERLRRGWTLQDVSIRTHFSITVLKALEGGRFESIGAPVIVEGLLRNYSTVLGIDAKSPGQEGANDVPGTETDHEPAPSGERVGGRKLAVVAFLACCGLAVIFLGLSLSGWRGLKTGIQTQGTQPEAGEDQAVKPSVTGSEPRTEGGEQPEVPRQTRLPAEVSGAENESPSPSPGSTPAGPPSPANPADSVQSPPGPADAKQGLELQPDDQVANPAVSPQPVAEPVKTNHHLEIQSDQRTWVQVVVDEGNAESELLQPGETREWKPMERARVVIGNGGGVRIKWDGKPVEISAKTGRVVRLTLPMP